MSEKKRTVTVRDEERNIHFEDCTIDHSDAVEIVPPERIGTDEQGNLVIRDEDAD